MGMDKLDVGGRRAAANPPLRLVVMTATIDPKATIDLWGSWRRMAALDWDGFALVNGGDAAEAYFDADQAWHSVAEPLTILTKGGSLIHRRDVLGPIPAFREVFVHGAFQDRMPDHDTIVAFLHDDLRIDERDWDKMVLELFRDPTVGMVGFGGAKGVGREGMYDCPLHRHPEPTACASAFDPMTLARHDFRSNMEAAEAHGSRTAEVQEVAVLDGFSLIGRAPLMWSALLKLVTRKVVHHAYDVAFGCETRRAGLKTVLLPIRCHHHGGMSAVGNPKYTGKFDDQGNWQHAHCQVWEEYRDVLPFWV